jgi:hypothetical protein
LGSHVRVTRSSLSARTILPWHSRTTERRAGGIYSCLFISYTPSGASLARTDERGVSDVLRRCWFVVVAYVVRSPTERRDTSNLNGRH